MARTVEASASETDGNLAGTQTIFRALAVLKLLRDAGTELGVTEVAREVGLNTSTTHRIIRALVHAGYVAQNPRTERYGLGREAFLLGSAAGRALGFDSAKAVLEELAEATGESVNLVIRDGDTGLIVVRIESKHPLRFTQTVGSRIPLYCTSTGKAMLAFAADVRAEVARLGKLQPLTPATKTSHRELTRDLEEVRRRGFSVNRGERIPGVCGVAAPVLRPGGAVAAALAVQGPEVRIPDERIPELAALVVKSAERVAAVLPEDGYRLS